MRSERGALSFFLLTLTIRLYFEVAIDYYDLSDGSHIGLSHVVGLLKVASHTSTACMKNKAKVPSPGEQWTVKPFTDNTNTTKTMW